jgi:hypothetical protein
MPGLRPIIYFTDMENIKNIAYLISDLNVGVKASSPLNMAIS